MRSDGVGEVEQVLLQREQRFGVEACRLRGRQRGLQGDRKTLRPLDQSALLQARQTPDVIVQRGDLKRDRPRIVGIENHEVAHRRQQRADEVTRAIGDLAIRQGEQDIEILAAGWRFLKMGCRVERAINTTRFARQFGYDEAGDDDLDILLTLVDCQITYRSRYLVGPVLAPVRDLVVLDPYNPRSVAFQIESLNEHIASLPALKENGLIERPQRLAVALRAALTTAEAAALDTKTLFSMEQDLLRLAEAIGLHYFPHGPNASRPEKLTGLA